MKKFHNISVEERQKILVEEGVSKDSIDTLNTLLPIEIADRMVENVVGRISLPLGILKGLKLNGKLYNVPMAIEEPSVIAAANKAARLTLPHGFFGEADKSIMIGQIHLTSFSKNAIEKLEEKYDYINEAGKSLASHMEAYGGGWKGFKFKKLKSSRKEHLVIYFEVDVSDSMGANTINTIAESLSKELEKITEGKAKLKIISNLAISRLARATAVWKQETIKEDCSKKGISFDEALEGILDAYDLASIDIFRLTTNNKGIMNGIDAVALALGQDWRAIEAGCHMYSCYKDKSPLASYNIDEENNIHGKIEVPLAVATVGGAVNTLPHAKAAFDILKVSSARELAMVMASVGLSNNFAAIYAIVTEGIQKGHMKLHAKNIAILAGAEGEEIDILAKMLSEKNNYTLENAKKLLKEIREKEV